MWDTEEIIGKSWFCCPDLSAIWILWDLFTYLQVKDSGLHPTLNSSIDQGPYVNVADGMVAAAGNEHTRDIIEEDEESKHPKDLHVNPMEIVPNSGKDGLQTSGTKSNVSPKSVVEEVKATSSVARSLLQISGRMRMSIWLLAYIAVVTSWPVVGSAIGIFLKRKIRRVFPRSA